jgi:hypothetical protein
MLPITLLSPRFPPVPLPYITMQHIPTKSSMSLSIPRHLLHLSG